MSERDALWMPSKVRGRADEFALWRAFRSKVGISWTGRDEDMFIAGWDAAKARLASEDEKKEDPSPSPGSGLSSRGADASEAA